MTDFRLFQTERVCRRQFQFDENGRKLSKQVENTVGKGEIACYEQFLLFPQYFQKDCFPGRQKVSLCGNGLNIIQDINVVFRRVEVMLGKGENAGYQHFFLFPFNVLEILKRSL